MSAAALPDCCIAPGVRRGSCITGRVALHSADWNCPYFAYFADFLGQMRSLRIILKKKHATTYRWSKLIDVELTGGEENYVNETSEDALNRRNCRNQRPSWVQTKTRNWIPGMFSATRPIGRNCSDRRERWLRRMRREDGLREGLKWDY